MPSIASPNRGGSKPSAVFRKCTDVSFILAFSLTIVAVWSVCKFTKHDANDWAVDHNELLPTY